MYYGVPIAKVPPNGTTGFGGKIKIKADLSLTDSVCFQPNVSSRESGPGYLEILVSGFVQACTENLGDRFGES